MTATRTPWRDVPIPERMQRLDRDRRGYPIPFLVLRDPDGGANFTINDSRKRAACLAGDLCAVCGQPLFRGRWFVGGPLSAFHEQGAYLDPPTHEECAHYALRVCPYLAVPSYTGRIDDAGFDWDQHPNEAMLVDPTVIPDRPELFVAVMAVKQRLVGDKTHPYVKPVEPYRRAEFWRHGEEISHFAALPLFEASLAALAQKASSGAFKPPPERTIRRPEA